ncbi:hypothetical protein I79_012786 [Cricetulus griseus]|uniref:Uncharacterized protein n=1 Tax=Cricetulus griseus TaxID=10029 RepID=G3HPR9_CRIGR|nr:hypothetical protein I79_012786 [Cricetulus griseus]
MICEITTSKSWVHTGAAAASAGASLRPGWNGDENSPLLQWRLPRTKTSHADSQP